MTATFAAEQFRDPRWRLSNLYWITDKDGAKVRFEPNGSQLDFLDNLHTLNIILKARQLGFTTFCCLIYLDAALFTPNTRAGVIAHKLDDAKVIFRDKIRFPYDNLPDLLRQRISPVEDSADTLTLSNNSSIRVSTSMRSGTLQYLHISEFGKICARTPDKAEEIVTGALNTVASGQFIAIESTAEGQDGYFYKMTEEARRMEASGEHLTPLDFKFHFYPWYLDPSYVEHSVNVVIGEDDERYFRDLETKGITLSPEQKRWYVKKAAQQGSLMKREFPSTPVEAFEQAIEGAYFSTELYIAEKQRRIGGFPLDPNYQVNTFWDLGRRDYNTIWLHQRIKGYDNFVGYYENSGEHISHYIAWLKTWATDNGAQFGKHYLPHDGDRQSLWLENGTMGVMEKLKFFPEIVERPSEKLAAINVARTVFHRCRFDAAGAKEGLNRLRNYRKEWDDRRGVWRESPLHDANSHGADAFMTFAATDLGDEQLVAPKIMDAHRKAYYDTDAEESWTTL